MQKFFLSTIAFLFFVVPVVHAQDFEGVPYGPESRQFLDIYIAPSSVPTPVYFDAHGNGGTTNMPSSIINDLKAVGISTVAWESLTSVNTPDQVQTGWDDAELMFAWVKANAETYNFDTTNFIIGGSSRGSILSWKYGHRPDPNVKGLYMYNALPDGVWADSTWWHPPSEVKVTSPPIFFVYRYEPGVTFDSHDPENGMIIMDKYDELGIGDRDTLIHSIEYTPDNDKYQFLVDFALSVICVDPVLSLDEGWNLAPIFNAYPNPFNERLEISGLEGGEYFVLTNTSGEVMKRGNDFELFEVSKLNSGIYFLTIQRGEKLKVLKLIKN